MADYNQPIWRFVLKWHDTMPGASKKKASEFLIKHIREDEIVLDDAIKADRGGDLRRFIRYIRRELRRNRFALSLL